MSIRLADRIKEVSYSTGTGDFILGGAFAGFSTFASSYSYGSVIYYAITDGTRYEIGSGEYLFASPNQIIRRYPFKSTNSDNKVDFPAGIKEVYVTYPGQKSVFTAGNFGAFSNPQNSGVAFWRSNQILDYDTGFVWDSTNNRLGINNAAPQHEIDVGGQNSRLRVSGITVGASGITFPQQGPFFSGGLQREPFLRNQLDDDTGTIEVFAMSGLVSERLTFKKQSPRYFLAGPVSGILDDYPHFRPLYIDDVPNLSSLYASSSGIGAGGQVAFYENGAFGADSMFVWNNANNRLGVNTATPTQTLEVNGNALFAGYADVRNYLSTISGIVTSGRIFFASGNAAPVGVLNWNNDDGTLDLGLKGGNVTLQIGQENIVMAFNDTSFQINDGQIVAINGVQGQRLSVVPAIASGSYLASHAIGIATENIPSKANGFVTTYGVVRHLNTYIDGNSEGKEIFLSPTVSGAWTTTRPVAPNHAVRIGFIQREHPAAGSIFTSIQVGEHLEYLHDVLLQSVASGNVLMYDSSLGLWRNGVISASGGGGGGAGGSGITNYLAKWDSPSSITSGIIYDSGNKIGIGTTNPQYLLDVSGTIAANHITATTKSFLINHPIYYGKKLRYASLEGPENGVYIRGTNSGNIIDLPNYWFKLVDHNSITVNLTPIGNFQNLFVKQATSEKIIVGGASGAYNYTVYAERKDVTKLVTECENG